MRYDEKEEILATQEWLMRLEETDHGLELEYVPTEIWRTGIPLQDVVDRIEEVREKIEASKVVAVGRAVVEDNSVAEAMGLIMMGHMLSVAEEEAAAVAEEEVPDHVPWDWDKPLEGLIEESIKAILSPEPGLLAFSEVASLVHLEVPEVPEVIATPAKRTRGKRARSSGSSTA